MGTLYRLTYAVSRDEIYTEEIRFESHDIIGATEEAIEHLEGVLGADAVLNLIALSILRVEEKTDGEGH